MLVGLAAGALGAGLAASAPDAPMAPATSSATTDGTEMRRMRATVPMASPLIAPYPCRWRRGGAVSIGYCGRASHRASPDSSETASSTPTSQLRTERPPELPVLRGGVPLDLRRRTRGGAGSARLMGSPAPSGFVSCVIGGLPSWRHAMPVERDEQCQERRPVYRACSESPPDQAVSLRWPPGAGIPTVGDPATRRALVRLPSVARIWRASRAPCHPSRSRGRSSGTSGRGR